MPVVDASVWVSLCHLRDSHHATCAKWLERLLVDGTPLLAPTLLVVELGAALRRLTGDPVLAAEAVSELDESGILELVPLSGERARRAAALASRTALRGADAVYVELARERGSALVTLDRQQLERGASVVNVALPSEDPLERTR